VTTVLIADDDLDLRETLADALAAHGFRVSTAGEGAEALTLVRASLPDLVLLDMMMPNVDGLQFLERLRRECSPPFPKVIAYSGFSGFGPLALSRGALGFLEKPFELRRLLATIRAILGAEPVPSGVPASEEMLKEQEQRREALIHAVPLDDPSLRLELLRLVSWAAGFFGVEKALVGLVHCHRLFVLAQSGTREFPEDTPLDPNLAYCPEVTRAAAPLVVRDSTADEPFRDRPAAHSRFRFYAGAPLLTKSGVSAGAFCVRDSHAFDFRAEDMAILSYLARRAAARFAALATHERAVEIFAGDLVLFEESLLVILDAELRRAERDRTSVALAVIDGHWTESLTRAAIGAANARHLAHASVGPSLTALVLGAGPQTEADVRLDAALRAIAAECAPRAVGRARFDGTAHRLFAPRGFLQAAVDALEAGHT
jgi:CheY-like chemotaxis protein